MDGIRLESRSPRASPPPEHRSGRMPELVSWTRPDPVQEPDTERMDAARAWSLAVIAEIRPHWGGIPRPRDSRVRELEPGLDWVAVWGETGYRSH